MKKAGRLNSQSGTSLIEMMIAVAIMSIIFTSMMFMVSFAMDERKRVVSKTIQEKILQSVSADLRSDSSIYQKNFVSAVTDNNTVLADANLPFRWNDLTEMMCDATVVTVPPCCPGCPGRMGYTIRPINGWPGMYMATVRLSNPSLNGGQAWFEFIVVPK